MSQNSVTPSQARSTDFTFDANGQFPVSVTLGTVSLTTSFTWDYLRGMRASVTGPDQLTTSLTYDNFGRLKRETTPAGSTDYSLYDCYGSCWPQYGKLFVHAQGSDGSDGYEFLDKLQRPVGKSWTLPLGTQGRRETRYDAYGRVDRASQPYVYLDGLSPALTDTSRRADNVPRG